jgi:RHS repeat-associated protein
MEKDPEIKGEGNSYTTEFRQYDPRLGRWLSLDPLMTKFPWMSPYVAFDNNPVLYNDPLGLESNSVNGDKKSDKSKKSKDKSDNKTEKRGALYNLVQKYLKPANKEPLYKGPLKNGGETEIEEIKIVAKRIPKKPVSSIWLRIDRAMKTNRIGLWTDKLFEKWHWSVLTSSGSDNADPTMSRKVKGKGSLIDADHVTDAIARIPKFGKYQGKKFNRISSNDNIKEIKKKTEENLNNAEEIVTKLNSAIHDTKLKEVYIYHYKQDTEDGAASQYHDRVFLTVNEIYKYSCVNFDSESGVYIINVGDGYSKPLKNGSYLLNCNIK